MIRPYTPFLRFAKWPPAGGRCVCRAPAFTALCFLVNAVKGPQRETIRNQRELAVKTLIKKRQVVEIIL